MKIKGPAHVPRFYLNTPLAPGQAIILQDEQAHHLLKVLRARPGDALILFNGDGNEYSGQIGSVEKSHVQVDLQAVASNERESNLRLTLAQGIARGDRMDQAIAKAVELGVHAIQPLFTARGKVRLDAARMEKKQHHWQRVAQSAAEQSGRTTLPQVYRPCALDKFLQTPCSGLGLVLSPNANQTLSSIERADDITLLIGPESGLDPDEVKQAIASGYTAMRFGPRILRTETAGPACLAVLQNLWGDLK